MTNKETGKVKIAQETQEEASETKDTNGANEEIFKARIEATAKEIEKVLVEANLGLHPFLEFTINGIIPRVKLVEKIYGKQAE